jgi:RHS repeat-associated protein
MPFGEELGAGVGGRTTGMGFIVTDGLRQKFTQKERDIETGLDYFGARHYAGAQGRFTSPDEFWKDSQVRDSQSWNKYAYARNNPLKYIDQMGEKATVTIETDEENKKGKITVKAIIALWSSSNNAISPKELQKAAQEYKKNIEKAWSGTYEQNGIKYDVSTTVDIQVYNSEKDATDSKSQNVLEVVPSGNATFIKPAGLPGGPDVGQIEIDGGPRGLASHEFTHLVGVDDRYSGAYLSNTYEARRGPNMNATAYDYGWAFGGAINIHRDNSRPLNPVPLGILNKAPAARGYGAPRSYRSETVLRAGRIWWH